MLCRLYAEQNGEEAVTILADGGEWAEAQRLVCILSVAKSFLMGAVDDDRSYFLMRAEWAQIGASQRPELLDRIVRPAALEGTAAATISELLGCQLTLLRRRVIPKRPLCSR